MPFLAAFLTPTGWLPVLWKLVTSPTGMIVIAFIGGFTYGEVRAHKSFNQKEMEQRLHEAERDSAAKDVAINEQSSLMKKLTDLRAKDKEKIDAFARLLEKDTSCHLSQSDVQRLRDIGR